MRRAWPALLLLALGCNEPTPRTQVMLVIDAEPAIQTETRSLHVHIFGGQAGQPTSSFASRYDRAHEDPTYPFSIALVPLEPEPPRAWLATVETRNADDIVITRTTLRGGYAEERTVRIDVRVEDACAGVLCESQRCVDGECIDPLVDVASSPDLLLDGGS